MPLKEKRNQITFLYQGIIEFANKIKTHISLGDLFFRGLEKLLIKIEFHPPNRLFLLSLSNLLISLPFILHSRLLFSILK